MYGDKIMGASEESDDISTFFQLWADMAKEGHLLTEAEYTGFMRAIKLDNDENQKNTKNFLKSLD